jgi:dihydrofolate reductase
MGKLVYAAITSLDGYIADRDGNFDWAEPDAEVHAAVNELQRGVGTYLYGRRMYEVMRAWAGPLPDDHPVTRDFAALWRAADKVVYSTTLDEVSTSRTRLERELDPVAVRALKARTRRDVEIGGPTVAAAAFDAGLVDECHLFVNPVSVGGGLPALPRDVRVDLALVDVRRFTGGVVHLHHRVCRSGA